MFKIFAKIFLSGKILGHWRAICFVACSSISSLVAADDWVGSELPISLGSTRVWDSSAGLPHNTAQAITQTKEGYLWVATWEGVARFNGRDWKVFDRENIPGLSDSGIRSLLAASDGALWVGSARDGLFRYFEGRWVAIPYGENLAEGQIASLYQDKKLQIWALTGNNEVLTIGVDGKITRIAASLKEEKSRFQGFQENQQGELFLSSSEGLYKFNGSNAFALQSSSFAANAILAMAKNVDGKMVVATEAGLYIEDGKTFSLLPGTASIHEKLHIDSMLIETNDRILLGTQGDGLYCFCVGKLEHYSTKNGLVNNRIASLFLDREKSLWIGTNLGVVRLHRGNITKYTKTNGLSDDYVRAVVNIAANGVTWVGTSDGLNRIKNHEITRLGKEQGLPSNNIYSLLQRNADELWIGTDSAGIAIYKQNRFDRIGLVDGLPELQVRAMVADGEQVWVGLSGRAGGGVALIKSGKVVRMFAENLSIRSLFLDTKSRVWVGTTTGLYVIENGMLLRRQAQGLSLQYVFGFHEDKRGALWVAADNGLYRLMGEKVTQIGLSRGLPHVPLLGIVGDDESIWACSNHGVIELKHSDLEAVASGAKHMLDSDAGIDVSGEYAGLQCNGGGNPIMGLQPPYLFFSTSSGLALVNTRKVDKALRMPEVIFEKWLVDGQQRVLANDMRLPAGVQRIQISYAALTFKAPEQINFRVKLHGFEDDWRPVTKLTEVTYTNLPPGHFELWVEADNGFGIKSETISKMPFSIAPYFWQRPLFWWLVLLGAALAIYLLIKFILGKNRDRQIDLERQVLDRTNAINDYAKKLEVINNERQNMLSVLEKQAAGLAKLASEDSLTGLSNRRSFEDEATELFHAAKKEKRELCLAVVDVDLFKEINDRFGHHAGDAVLQHVADKLKSATRGRDVVSRIGGDEFAMAFPGMTADAVIEICERLCREVAALDFSDIDPDIKVTLSIGISDLPHAQSFERILADADRALYEAKKSGRNCVAR
jgi:diguanylate cyclase (GGDEF)-like protein